MFGGLVEIVYFCSQIFDNSLKIAVMQRQKYSILGGLNIQGTWRFECDSYMHTPSIAASSNLHRTAFHIARGGSGLLPS